MIIDAHHHVWDPDTRAHTWLDSLPGLRRRFSPADFTLVAADYEVTASVLVQVLASAAETEEFLALAATPGVVAAVVGWADLTAPGVADEIGRLRQLPGGGCLVGLRHLVQTEPDPGRLDRRGVRRGIRGVG